MADEEPKAPAGWYPDPAGSDQQRWWDGEQWTDRLQDPPGRWQVESPAGPPAQTSGWAVATVILGVLGAILPSVVVGLIARRKIRESGGRLTGERLITAGFVASAVWGVGFLVVALLASSGSLDAENRDDFRGPQREVAVVVDRMERAFAEDDGDLACRELLTPNFARRIGGPRGARGCPAEIEDAVPDELVQVELDVRSVEISGDRATAAVEEGDDAQAWRFVRGRDGRWRVDDIS